MKKFLFSCLLSIFIVSNFAGCGYCVNWQKTGYCIHFNQAPRGYGHNEFYDHDVEILPGPDNDTKIGKINVMLVPEQDTSKYIIENLQFLITIDGYYLKVKESNQLFTDYGQKSLEKNISANGEWIPWRELSTYFNNDAIGILKRAASYVYRKHIKKK